MRKLADDLNTTLTQDLSGSVRILNPIEGISSRVLHHNGEIRLFFGDSKKVAIRRVSYDDDNYSWSILVSVSKRFALFPIEFRLPPFRDQLKT